VIDGGGVSKSSAVQQRGTHVQYVHSEWL